MTDNTYIRDILAKERTIYAAERTGLSYFRTMLAFIASGGGLLHLFQTNKIFSLLGVLLISIGLIFLVLGFLRYRQALSSQEFISQKIK